MSRRKGGLGSSPWVPAMRGGTQPGAWHGDLCPLPQVFAEEPPPRRGLSRGVKQQINRRRAVQGACGECVDALNALTARGGSFRNVEACLDTSPTQRAVLERVRCVFEATSSGGADVCPDAALRTLLKTGPEYENGPVGELASFGTAKVSLPLGQVEACPLENVLEGDALEAILSPERRMLLGPEELEGILESGLANSDMDSVFRSSARKYASFVVDLFGCGIVGLEGEFLVENGLFFVKQKQDVVTYSRCPPGKPVLPQATYRSQLEQCCVD